MFKDIAFPEVLLSAHGRTRTCGLRFRKPSLYPAELRGHSRKCIVAEILIPVLLSAFNGISDV